MSDCFVASASPSMSVDTSEYVLCVGSSRKLLLCNFDPNLEIGRLWKKANTRRASNNKGCLTAWLRGFKLLCGVFSCCSLYYWWLGGCVAFGHHRCWFDVRYNRNEAIWRKTHSNLARKLLIRIIWIARSLLWLAFSLRSVWITFISLFQPSENWFTYANIHTRTFAARFHSTHVSTLPAVLHAYFASNLSSLLSSLYDTEKTKNSPNYADCGLLRFALQ